MRSVHTLWRCVLVGAHRQHTCAGLTYQSVWLAASVLSVTAYTRNEIISWDFPHTPLISPSLCQSTRLSLSLSLLPAQQYPPLLCAAQSWSLPATQSPCNYLCSPHCTLRRSKENQSGAACETLYTWAGKGRGCVHSEERLIVCTVIFPRHWDILLFIWFACRKWKAWILSDFLLGMYAAKECLIYYMHAVLDQYYNCNGTSNLPTSACNKRLTHTHYPFLTSALPGFTSPSRISRSDPCPTHSFGSGVFGTRSSPSFASFLSASPSTSAGGCQGVCMCGTYEHTCSRTVKAKYIFFKSFQFQNLVSHRGRGKYYAWETYMMRVVPGPLTMYLSTTQTYAIKGNWRQLTGSSKNLSLTGTWSGVYCCKRQC